MSEKTMITFGYNIKHSRYKKSFKYVNAGIKLQ